MRGCHSPGSGRTTASDNEKAQTRLYASRSISKGCSSAINTGMASEIQLYTCAYNSRYAFSAVVAISLPADVVFRSPRPNWAVYAARSIIAKRPNTPFQFGCAVSLNSSYRALTPGNCRSMWLIMVSTFTDLGKSGSSFQPIIIFSSSECNSSGLYLRRSSRISFNRQINAVLSITARVRRIPAATSSLASASHAHRASSSVRQVRASRVQSKRKGALDHTPSSAALIEDGRCARMPSTRCRASSR